MPELDDSTMHFHIVAKDIYDRVKAERDELRGRVSQLEDDLGLCDHALGVAYRALKLEARGYDIPLIVLKEAMHTMESTRRIHADDVWHWPG